MMPTQLPSANAIQSAIDALYTEVDVPKPGSSLPITPLGPLLKGLRIACTEQVSLTLRAVEEDLRRRRVIAPNGDMGLDPESDPNEPLSGFLYAAGQTARLYVNASDIVVRRRFSVAHELAHFLLHFRPRIARWEEALARGNETPPVFIDLFSVHQNSDENEKGEETLDRNEREADAFAAALLLPPALVLERLQFLTRDFYDNDALVERLASEMLVSRLAMRRCLHRLYFHEKRFDISCQ